jgi:DNA-directed RNA polymerase specialized sigma subunit
MGKKRAPKGTSNIYFGADEEKAVVDFLTSTDDLERNRIYNQWLKKPFNKMIESIIRRYGLYRKTESFEDLHSDTLSFLMTKANKFKYDKGKKAYSYYGTICKNYILGLLMKDDKIMIQKMYYDDVAEAIEDNLEFSYSIDEPQNEYEDFIKIISDEIKAELLNSANLEGKKKLSDNEINVGNAIIEILDNWQVIFNTLDESNKYNKNSFYASVRQYTNLGTKDIRTSLKRFKKIYNLVKTDKMQDEE